MSSWDDELGNWPGFPPLAGDAAADACVVGLGASGLAAIEALAGRGLSVIGVDAGRVAAGAAGRNGGFLIAGAEPPLHEAVARWGPCAVDLYRETLAELDHLSDLLGPDVVRRVGSIRLAGLPGPPASDTEAADREAELADCAAQAIVLRKHGIAVEDYAGPLGRGLYLPDDAATNPAVRATRLARLLARVAELHEHTPVTDVRAGRVTTRHGVVSAPTVVVAVDGRLDVLLPALRGRVRTARLQMLATDPVPARLPCPVYGRWGYDYGQQPADGRLFVGGGRDLFIEDEWTHDATPTAQVQDHIETVAGRLAGGPVRVTGRWAAPVGFTPDARPLCTLVDSGVVAIGGYSGTGNLVGPVAARAAVAQAVEGVAPAPYLSA
ncbi:MAG: NAD(P)/FAD-dependent oxidoreductase [Jatrophihabitans sp.]|uniref:NAD(P)/FAD-dependent oxidoreductase n=1 Tax=Jatrophihabitans sp. TaxID=1932789 RepID=UPI0039130DAA